jgi:hypothetical protein
VSLRVGTFAGGYGGIGVWGTGWIYNGKDDHDDKGL